MGEALPGAEGDDYIEAVMLLSFMTGLVQIGLAAVRGGIVVSFLADPVVSAFTTGAAVLIMSSQVVWDLKAMCEFEFYLRDWFTCQILHCVGYANIMSGI